MRIRQIKPAFWSDAKMYGLDPAVKLFYIGLWNEADDAGWLRWDPPQIALDLMPDVPLTEALGRVEELAVALEDRKRIRRFKCGHAIIPTLPENQHLGGPDKQVHTIAREHADCRARRSPRGPATARESPPGKVGRGKVGLGKGNAGAGAQERPAPEATAEEWAEILRGPINGAIRRRAAEELDRLGYHLSDAGELVAGSKGATTDA